jgi:thiol-disulfide isomerase/thioredoxin
MYEKICKIFLVTILLASFSFAQNEPKTSAELYKEVNIYVTTKFRELSSKGEKVDAYTRENVVRDQKKLADKYAKGILLKSDLTYEDAYYAGLLYDIAGIDAKTLEAFQKFMTLMPANATGDALQDARSRLVVLYSRKKQFTEMEKHYQDWIKGIPSLPKQRPHLENVIAVAYFKDGKYLESIKYGESAFNLLKTLEARNLQERNIKTEIYADLVEVLSLAYKKTKRNEDAINILAESRALAFTIPSATLYRKVMEIVAGSGVSEKKLMLKVESIKTTDPAPELAVNDWIGENQSGLEELRGKVVLVDFWATWCGPCISTFPKLRGWYKKYQPKGFEIIGVTQYYGSAGDKRVTPLQELDFVREFKSEHKLPYSLAISSKGETQAQYGVRALPTTVLLDRKGIVRYIGIGAGAEEVENLQEMLDKLIAEP